MAQMSRSLAQSILNGSGITRGEIMQLCHHYLHSLLDTSITIGDYTLQRLDDGSIWIDHHGEGMQISNQVFEDAIRRLYADNF